MADGQVPKNGFPKVVEQMAKLPRILFVGLNDDEIAHVEDSLGDIDCQIETVAAGSAVFDRLQRFQPHLVVLDTAIANPDAFDLCARIKNDHTAIVIFATAFSDLDDINRAVDAGTDDFLSKTINKHELRKRVENLLKLRDILD